MIEGEPNVSDDGFVTIKLSGKWMAEVSIFSFFSNSYKTYKQCFERLRREAQRGSHSLDVRWSFPAQNLGTNGVFLSKIFDSVLANK